MIAGTLKLELAQYREVMEFAKFGANLDAVTKQQLHRGARLVETLKQGQYQPLECSLQIAYIYWGISGYLDTKDVPYIKKLQTAAGAYFKKSDKRTAMDVLEHHGEITPSFKNYLFAVSWPTPSASRPAPFLPLLSSQRLFSLSPLFDDF